jgi:hypothetical protein
MTATGQTDLALTRSTALTTYHLDSWSFPYRKIIFRKGLFNFLSIGTRGIQINSFPGFKMPDHVSFNIVEGLDDMYQGQ